MITELIPQVSEAQAGDTRAIVVPRDADKDDRYRLGKFVGWLKQAGATWHTFKLAGYRDYLLAEGYAATTVRAMLSTVRGRYQDIVDDRDLFYAIVSQKTDNILERKAWVDEMVKRLENTIKPKKAPVKVKTSQDVPDAKHLRLTSRQASALMAAPGTEDLRGLRDTAVIATMLCTGIREAELSALEVRDLRQRFGGDLSLHVREGKGCKERLIPYGSLQQVLVFVDSWLSVAGISEGPVFRGFYKDNRQLRPGPLSVRAIQYILARYPVVIDGELVAVRPHDCRRTYARRLFVTTKNMLAVQQNLGHEDPKTTINYIGTLDAGARRPPAMYTFDLSGLIEQKRLEGMGRMITAIIADSLDDELDDTR